MSVLTTPDPGASSGNQSSAAPTDWRAALPEDLRNDSVFEAIKGKDWAEAGPVLAKGYKSAQSMVGADKVILPGKDATPEQMAEFYTKLGRPAKPEDYAHTLPEGMKPEQLDTKLIDGWRKELHEAGIPKGSAERLINKFIKESFDTNTAQLAQADAQSKAWDTELRAKFGDKYDTEVNFAKYAMSELAPKGLAEFLDSTGLGDHPALIEMFSKAGRAISDDTARGGGNGRFGNTPRNPGEAQAAITVFEANADNQKALWDSDHPNHANVVKERNRLYQLAYPKEATP